MDWRARVRAALLPGGVPDEDVVEELAQHAVAVYDGAVRDGVDEEKALRLAEGEISSLRDARRALVRPRARRAALEPPPVHSLGLAGFVHDLGHAVRRLTREPWHAALVVSTLAIGIATTTALFSVVSGVLLAPLPWPNGERLVRLAETREGGTRQWPWRITNGTYLALSEGARALDGLAAWGTGTVTWSASGDPERVRIAWVTASLFPLLEARPQVGRVFAASEEGEHVLLLSDRLWQRRFGGSREVIGQIVRLDGEPHRVIGVLPREFAFLDQEATAWAPFRVDPVLHADGTPAGLSIFAAIARLRSGVTAQQAADEATTLSRHAPDPGLVTAALFGSHGAPRVAVTPARDALTAEVRPALLLLLSAMGLLLATATANVASLQLVRATARRRELAIRSALGAGQGRLARLLIADSLVLGLLGGAGGLLLAALGVRLLPALLPADFPRLEAVAINARVAAFSAALALTCGVGAGILPALFAGRLRIAEVIADDSAGSVGAGRPAAARARTLILVGQVAAATVLLLGALQFARSFVNLLSAERGYVADGLLTIRLPLPDPAYTPLRRQQIVASLLDRLAGLPTVAAVGMTSIGPLNPAEAMMAWSVTTPDGSAAQQVNTSLRDVTPGYFRALGRRMVEGRPLLDSDAGGAPVIVVNRTFARRYLRTRAVGTSVPARLDGKRTDWTVVGVVEDVVQRSVTDPPQPEVLVDYRQKGTGLEDTEPTLLVRTSGDPLALVPAVRALLREADPALAPGAIVPMSQLVRDSLARPRLYSMLLGLFAACALAVAGVGLFGSLSYGVALRTREIGVRLALGAPRGSVALMVVKQSLAVTAGGVALGLAGSLAFGRLIGGFLYGVAPHDAIGLLTVPALLLLSATTVTAIPALRAARVDPQRALRSE
jgi:predicted permease